MKEKDTTKSANKAQLPTYSGKTNENLRNWIFLVETRFDTDNILPAKQIDFVVGYLRDLALETYRHMGISGRKPTWTEVKKRFINQFEPYNAQARLRGELLQLKQGSGPNSYNTYVYDFQRLVNQVVNMDDEDKMTYFIMVFIRTRLNK